LEVVIDENDVLVAAGRISSVLEGVIVVQARAPRASSCASDPLHGTSTRMAAAHT
jgi:hypothetical protein